MEFVLILDLEGAVYYGKVPERFYFSENKLEKTALEPDDWPLLDLDFVDQVNDLCGTLLDNGDVDFFNPYQCSLLGEWLSERLERPCNPRLRSLYEILLDYSIRAIKLGTGVVVEL